jgi:sterol desaturase/sphingolipid hydroxylase (fatty acid hydroxylase superfamily)
MPYRTFQHPIYKTSSRWTKFLYLTLFIALVILWVYLVFYNLCAHWPQENQVTFRIIQLITIFASMTALFIFLAIYTNEQDEIRYKRLLEENQIHFNKNKKTT